MRNFLKVGLVFWASYATPVMAAKLIVPHDSVWQQVTKDTGARSSDAVFQASIDTFCDFRELLERGSTLTFVARDNTSAAPQELLDLFQLQRNPSAEVRYEVILTTPEEHANPAFGRYFERGARGKRSWYGGINFVVSEAQLERVHKQTTEPLANMGKLISLLHDQTTAGYTVARFADPSGKTVEIEIAEMFSKISTVHGQYSGYTVPVGSTLHGCAGLDEVARSSEVLLPVQN